MPEFFTTAPEIPGEPPPSRASASTALQPGTLLTTIQALEAACFPTAAWTPPQIAASLQSPGFRVVLIQADGAVQEYRFPNYHNEGPPPHEPAGYALLQSLPAEATLEILRLGILPQFRRQGLALILLEFLDTINANFPGAGDYLSCQERFLLLEVNAGNAAALALYRRHGFTELDRRRAYYAAANDAREDAIVLRKSIQSDIQIKGTHQESSL